MHPRPRYLAKGRRGAGKLAGRVALITGGDSGIGRAVAVLFAREGADVAFVHLPEESSDARETRRAVGDEGRRCIPIRGDVRDPRFCQRAVARTVRELGGLDILVNNAAYQKHCERLEDLTDVQLVRTFHTNLFGYVFMTRAALPHLRRGAAIVNCGSITGLVGSKQLLDYSASKGAIHAFTKALAQNLVERGIRVNCVAPGPAPMHRPAQPEEIAPAFVFFAANDDSSYVSGEVMTLLGGETTAG